MGASVFISSGRRGQPYRGGGAPRGAPVRGRPARSGVQVQMVRSHRRVDGHGDRRRKASDRFFTQDEGKIRRERGRMGSRGQMVKLGSSRTQYDGGSQRRMVFGRRRKKTQEKKRKDYCSHVTCSTLLLHKGYLLIQGICTCTGKSSSRRHRRHYRRHRPPRALQRSPRTPSGIFWQSDSPGRTWRPLLRPAS